MRTGLLTALENPSLNLNQSGWVAALLALLLPAHQRLRNSDRPGVCGSEGWGVTALKYPNCIQESVILYHQLSRLKPAKNSTIRNIISQQLVY